MTWPKEYGGHERSAMERYAVTEELLAAGAPVAGHWIADRQSGPNLLTYGTERQRAEILPRIAAGGGFFVIGMSRAHPRPGPAPRPTPPAPHAGGRGGGKRGQGRRTKPPPPPHP